MKLYVNILGAGVRGVEVYVDQYGYCTSGYWLDDETELTEADLDLVHEAFESEVKAILTEAKLDALYDAWKASRFE